MSWDVHVYQAGSVTPARTETFDRFIPAFGLAMALKKDRPNGWHVHVAAPTDATEEELGQLQENALSPG